jgi:hypothetical protein
MKTDQQRIKELTYGLEMAVRGLRCCLTLVDQVVQESDESDLPATYWRAVATRQRRKLGRAAAVLARATNRTPDDVIGEPEA